MKYVRYRDFEAFQERALPFLSTKEVENNLPIGLIQGRMLDDACFMAVVETDHGTRLVACMAPPHNLIVCSEPEEDADALAALAEGIAQDGVEIPSCIGSERTVAAFNDIWIAQQGCSSSIEKRLRIHFLTTVDYAGEAEGEFAVASGTDLPLALSWDKDFAADVGESQHVALRAKTMAQAVEAGRVYLWNSSTG